MVIKVALVGFCGIILAAIIGLVPGDG